MLTYSSTLRFGPRESLAKSPNLAGGRSLRFWRWGPITQDTFDQSNDLSTRDLADKDGRPKDWYPDGAIASDLPDLPKAFAPGGRMIIWGCSHMENVVA